MSNNSQSLPLDQQQAADLSIKAGKVFQPRAPISDREFFAGRWEQLTTVVDAVSQTGLHIVIFGERGVGKTSLANIIDILLQVMEDSSSSSMQEERLVVKVNTHQGDKFATVWTRVFEEVAWEQDRPVMGIIPRSIKDRVTLKVAFGLPDEPSIDDVRRVMNALPRSVFIFDEFDRGNQSLRLAFTDLIKALSDYAVNTTIVLVGVSDTVDHLIRDHASIVRSVVQIQLPRMKEKELAEILEKAASNLGIQFSELASSLIIRMSQGLPHYTHLIGLHAAREAVNRRSAIVESADVHQSFQKATKQAVQSIQEKYMRAIHSAHKDALYKTVILACAVASATAKDALGYFHPTDVLGPLSGILSRNNVTISTFQKHINEFCEEERGAVLQREGIPRAYKYRFQEPLLPPFIFMTAVAEGLVDGNILGQLTKT